jgi:hypothetical protein
LGEEEQIYVLLYAVEALGRIGPEAKAAVPSLRRRAAAKGFVNEFLSDVFSHAADRIEFPEREPMPLGWARQKKP